jgi:hypothetical protein
MAGDHGPAACRCSPSHSSRAELARPAPATAQPDARVTMRARAEHVDAGAHAGKQGLKHTTQVAVGPGRAQCASGGAGGACGEGAKQGHGTASVTRAVARRAVSRGRMSASPPAAEQHLNDPTSPPGDPAIVSCAAPSAARITCPLPAH